MRVTSNPVPEYSGAKAARYEQNTMAMPGRIFPAERLAKSMTNTMRTVPVIRSAASGSPNRRIIAWKLIIKWARQTREDPRRQAEPFKPLFSESECDKITYYQAGKVSPSARAVNLETPCKRGKFPWPPRRLIKDPFLWKTLQNSRIKTVSSLLFRAAFSPPSCSDRPVKPVWTVGPLISPICLPICRAASSGGAGLRASSTLLCLMAFFLPWKRIVVERPSAGGSPPPAGSAEEPGCLLILQGHGNSRSAWITPAGSAPRPLSSLATAASIFQSPPPTPAPP